ncbi:cyclic nucleotide-binding domain-containing protein [Thiomicrorhabdus xiamenensis]|uniref:Cyclic nucleotide-binding domain-containing protein n=1 Tax=Thiomicrorhabdus xiamenensis TaxID=2739063 RepID=A0A7D4NNX1_9GAMM|nr:cyclic nucleotide-binding domain-containing protein [Thiomicrorhabdus xiamenensis]QKI89113.1 cyclic nucleotide-binding domain-containing protein [Thiomicrorhabdus xiamenensis]
MLESVAVQAFWIGIISAVSLPLGALVTYVWQPGQRHIALLMAFGAGALLFALTIDLFAPMLNSGMALTVSVGAIIGSLVYLGLNYLLNQKGGFLRKRATTLQFFRNRVRRQRTEMLRSLKRLNIFHSLDEKSLHQLVAAIDVVEVKAGQVIYHHGDRAGSFYVLCEGVVSILDPQKHLQKIIQLEKGDTFGRMAFFTGLNNATMAIAKSDCVLWCVDYHCINDVLQESSELYQTLLDFYVQESRYNTELLEYLQQRHFFSLQQAQEYLRDIQAHLLQYRELESHHYPEHELNFSLFKLAQRLPWIKSLPEEDLQLFARGFEWRTLKAGDTLYKGRVHSDQLYWLEEGVVNYWNPHDKTGLIQTHSGGDFFGVRAFLLGAKEAMTVEAKTDIEYWVLKRNVFAQLLKQSEALRSVLKKFIKNDAIDTYLVENQNLSTPQAHIWLNQTVRHLWPDRLPNLSEWQDPVLPKHTAYLAIWLGIFLDGIPESLTIGGLMTLESAVSLSLIMGLFLSNFPEALSSSASMRAQGIPFVRIFMAWFSLMLFTGVGAAFGVVFLHDADDATFALINGMAAGAMLTVIAETMLPEAYHKGGSIIGFITLLGFLAALLFKAIETT